MALLNVQNLSISFGPDLLLDNVSFQLHEGEKIALIGRNGAGKSTFLKIIQGSISADSGEIIRQPEVKVASLSQDVPDSRGTIYDIIHGGVDKEDDHSDIDTQINRLTSQLNIDPHLIFEDQSVGVKRRTLLARALVNNPDILLLDEPTNHLDIESIDWLEKFLVKTRIAILFITHDRLFLQNIANRIIEIDRGKLFNWDCDYRTYLERKESYLEAEEANNIKFDKKLQEEEAWLRKGVKARRTRNEGRVRALKKMREERKERRERSGNVKLRASEAEKSGKIVIEADNLLFNYDDKPIVKDFSTIIQRGDKIGLIGPNGIGKSTLIKLLIGEIESQGGNVKHGTNLQVAYFDQLREQLDESRTVLDNIANGSEMLDIGGKSKHVMGYLQDFLFSPERARSKVEVLSGGEKNRLLLARLFTRPANFLILDEPTNDLDSETLELLEDLLVEFEGTILLVSHDRAFLNNVVTSSFVFEGDGVVTESVGGYDDWIRFKESKAPEKSVKKERVKTVAKGKLSFKEKRELEEIPQRIEVLENEHQEICNTLSSTDSYKGETELDFQKLKDKLSEIEAELDILFARWEELEKK